jgi:Ser/Thr protein kinase RdoA (MazF antagonist)
MDPKIAERYNDNILREAMQRYSIQQNEIELLDGFESFMYEFYRPQDGEFILRIGHSLRRTPEMIAGEVDWINYLAQGGAGVAKAILSQDGNLIEAIDDGLGGQFLATAFLRAPGGPVSKDTWNEKFFVAWGRLLGRIHALSKEYTPSNPAWQREAWDSPGNMTVEDWLPPSDTVICHKFQELMCHLQSLPKDRQSFGMIHQDAHAGNLFVDEDYHITLFDFDDCVYGWFIYDIAMVFFYGLMGYESDPAFIEGFCRAFFRGYCQENRIDPCWLAEMPHFLKLREIDLYAQILFSFGGEENVDDVWCQKYMRGRKEHLEAGLPTIDFDWKSLARYLKHSN